MAKCPKCGRKHKEKKFFKGMCQYTCPKKHNWLVWAEIGEFMGPEEYREFKSRLRPPGDFIKGIV